jgi:hypothetical protein
MKDALTTSADVIDVLDGLDGVRLLTGCKSTKVVHNWKAAGVFPARTYVVMTWALQKKRKSAPAALWGMIPIPAEAA